VRVSPGEKKKKKRRKEVDRLGPKGVASLHDDPRWGREKRVEHYTKKSFRRSWPKGEKRKGRGKRQNEAKNNNPSSLPLARFGA